MKHLSNMPQVSTPRADWILETQMFQRIAKVEVSSYEELAADWDSWKRGRQTRELDHIKTHRAIQDQARKAGEERKS